MKKKLFNLTFFAFFLTVFLSIKAAGSLPVFSVLCRYLSWVQTILLFLGILGLLFVGYRILTSTGEPAKLEESKKVFIIVILGMALIFGIGALLQMVGLGWIINLCS